MMMKILLIAVCVNLSSSSDPYPYNQFQFNFFVGLPFYPDTCCQLMWQDITPKEYLPKTFVQAGDFMGRKWAFGRGIHNVVWPFTFSKSDQRGEPPNWIGRDDVFSKSFDSYPILVNPNNCQLGWYRTRFFKELTPQIDDWFFPSMGNSNYGDYVRHQDIPCRYRGYLDRGDFFKMSTLTESQEMKDVQGIELLYVDCKKSILSMSSAKLFNITYDENIFKDLQSNPQKVIYHKKMLLNNSPMPSKANVEFQIETIDNASMNLMDSYSDIFKTGSRTYREFVTKTNVGGNAGFNFFGITFGASAGHERGNVDGSEHISTSDKSRAGSKEIFRSKSERRLFKFGQEIQIPPYSKVTVTAFSKPVRGEIPFSAIYELSPTNYLKIEHLEKTIAKYFPGEKMKQVGDKLHMTYDGVIEIDSGHEVDVDIQTIPLPGHSFDSNYESNVQTYRLKGETIM